MTILVHRSFNLITRAVGLDVVKIDRERIVLPRAQWNGGRFGHDELIEVSAQWLRFRANLTFFRPGSAPARRGG